MFSAIGKAVSRFFSGGNCEDADTGDSLSDKNQTVRETAPTSDVSSEAGIKELPPKKDCNVIIQKGDPPCCNVKHITGRVTQLHSGYGLIDNDIYFKFDTVIGGTRPPVGSQVHVTAHREHDQGGWKARSVMPFTEWDADVKETPSPPVAETLVGTVTQTSKDGGTINNNVTFTADVLPAGYRPFRGDWVQCQTQTNDITLDVTAVSVQPLRERSFEGEVTACLHSYGVIDGEIYFSFRVCPRNYVPKKGDCVTGSAIESKQNVGSWRALSVQPKSSHDFMRSVDRRLPSLPASNLAKLLENKGGIAISTPLTFGKLKMGEEKYITVWMKNNSLSPRSLRGCKIISTDIQLKFEIPNVNQPCGQVTLKHDSFPVLNIIIYPQMSVYVNIICNASLLGRHSQLAVFDFGIFTIGRHVEFEVEDPQQTALAQRQPFQLSSKYSRFCQSQRGRRGRGDKQRLPSDQWIMPGERPIRVKNVILPVKLSQYFIPMELRECVSDGQDLSRIRPELSQDLCLQNYSSHFSTLLHLEEMQMEIDIRDFDLEKVSMKPLNEYLVLQVPGLAEGRPSVLVGDKVILSVPDGVIGSPQYEGFVHEVLSEELLLKFHPEFHQRYKGEEYDVMFTFNRAVLRRCHQAVEFARNVGEQVLFPTTVALKSPQWSLAAIKNLQWKNKSQELTRCRVATEMINVSDILALHRFSNFAVKDKTSMFPVQPATQADRDHGCVEHVNGLQMAPFFNSHLNERQRSTVFRILEGLARPTPYVIFGPPGTGKTVTVAEAILQVFSYIPSSRIIVCAPSNSAADLLAERLHESGRVKLSDMSRLNGFQRHEETVSDVIKPYCSDGNDLELVAHHRIVVSTCASAGMLYQLGLKSGHFTHVFVDEAGQATEPECLIAVGLVAGEDGQIVLAGDPRQLGPVLTSRAAIKYGLNVSFLERLTSRPPYCRDEAKYKAHGNYNPYLISKLVDNYRSHPALLKLPSQIFYHDELSAKADVKIRESLCTLDLLPNKDAFPILFHGIRGEDMREGNSPSWFNPVEAVQVMKYLSAVMNNGVHHLRWSDVGVITPYRKQVEKIRLLKDSLGMGDIKVGSVEEFQGQERLVVIISTVRSSENLVGFDARHNIGFLSNSKRFNVAITRAKALLIIIGNPHVLVQDYYWLQLLRYCVRNNAYTGCELPNFDEEVADVLFTEHGVDQDTSKQNTRENLNSPSLAEEDNEDTQSLCSRADQGICHDTEEDSNVKDTRNDQDLSGYSGQEVIQATENRLGTPSQNADEYKHKATFCGRSEKQAAEVECNMGVDEVTPSDNARKVKNTVVEAVTDSSATSVGCQGGNYTTNSNDKANCSDDIGDNKALQDNSYIMNGEGEGKKRSPGNSFTINSREEANDEVFSVDRDIERPFSVTCNSSDFENSKDPINKLNHEAAIHQTNGSTTPPVGSITDLDRAPTEFPCSSHSNVLSETEEGDEASNSTNDEMSSFEDIDFTESSDDDAASDTPSNDEGSRVSGTKTHCTSSLASDSSSYSWSGQDDSSDIWSGQDDADEDEDEDKDGTGEKGATVPKNDISEDDNQADIQKDPEQEMMDIVHESRRATCHVSSPAVVEDLSHLSDSQKSAIGLCKEFISSRIQEVHTSTPCTTKGKCLNKEVDPEKVTESSDSADGKECILKDCDSAPTEFDNPSDQNEAARQTLTKPRCKVVCKAGRHRRESADDQRMVTFEEIYGSLSLSEVSDGTLDEEDQYGDVDVIIESSCEESAAED
ncbi:RNA helicase Mov10l1-like [Ptychodera flava]|uniref:RNA helicase Mov10l1-like n=1 Tax=Ptychodera flava TaxID=63121 RepID=UPI00396AA796